MAELQIPGIELEYAFSISMNFAERIDFVGPRRGKGYVPPASGTVYGPLLNGKVVPYSGADFAIFKELSQGIKANTHYMLQADDGTWIYINNRGYLNRSPDPDNPGQTKLYFRMTPFFEAPAGPHEWLARTMIVGTGERLTNPDRSQFTYYRVKYARERPAMTITRRAVLQTAAGSALLVPLVPAAARATTPAQPTDFDGAGLYLYPDWGQPRAYLVVPTGPAQSVLEFRDPVTAALCWTQSLTLTGRFAAKLV